MATLERAIELAARAHAGQVDKGGQPYILHCLRVMLQLDDNEARMAAVLHDIVEDTAVTYADLVAEGFPEAVVEAVRVLTKQPGESRIDAARRAAGNELARRVKLADNADNSTPGRIAEPTERDRARLVEYAEVRALLLAAAPR